MRRAHFGGYRKRISEDEGEVDLQSLRSNNESLCEPLRILSWIIPPITWDTHVTSQVEIRYLTRG